MTNTTISQFVRYVDIALLLAAILLYPIFFLGISVFLWSSIPSSHNSFLLILLIFVFLIISILWNTRFGIGGTAFIPPLKNYLKHNETNIDMIYARISIIFHIGFFLIIYLYFITFP